MQTIDVDCVSGGWSEGDCETPGLGAISEIGAADQQDLADTGSVLGPHLMTTVLAALLLIAIGAIMLGRVLHRR